MTHIVSGRPGNKLQAYQEDWLVVFEVVYGMKNIIFKSGGNEGDVSVFCYFLN